MVPLSFIVQLVGAGLILVCAYVLGGPAGAGLAIGIGLYLMGNELVSGAPGPPGGR